MVELKAGDFLKKEITIRKPSFIDESDKDEIIENVYYLVLFVEDNKIEIVECSGSLMFDRTVYSYSDIEKKFEIKEISKKKVVWETIYKKIPDKSPEAATKYSGIGYFDVKYGYVLRRDNKECFIKASEYYSYGNGVWLKYPDSHFNYIEEEIDNT